MFHHLLQYAREALPDRPWHAAYAPPVLAAAVDHGTSWVTLAGLTIGFGGLTCHGIQTYLRVCEFRAAARRRN